MNDSINCRKCGQLLAAEGASRPKLISKEEYKKSLPQPFKLTKWYHRLFYFLGWFCVFNPIFWISIWIVSARSIHDKWLDKIRKTVFVWGIIFVILVVVIALSTFAVIFYGYNENQNNLNYNGFKFVREDNQWVTQVNNKQVAFDFYPEEVDFIEVSPDIIALLKSTVEIDVTSDVDSDFRDTIALAEYSLSNFLDENTNTYLQLGFTTRNEYDKPIMTCQSATKTAPLIYFKISDKTSVNLVDNCIIAEAKSDPDFIKIKDRLLYGLLGIIK